jgi:quercetin dioxygenase-like cupin family protein
MAAETRVVWMPGGVRTEIHLTADETGAAFCLLVDHPPAGWSLPAHRHHNEAETIHIVEGEFEMVLDGARSQLSAGQTMHVPRNVIHSGANIGDQPGRRVLLFSPAGIERFFLEAGAPTPGSGVDPAAVLDSATRHGWEFIPSP